MSTAAREMLRCRRQKARKGRKTTTQQTRRADFSLHYTQLAAEFCIATYRLDFFLHPVPLLLVVLLLQGHVVGDRGVGIGIGVVIVLIIAAAAASSR